LKGTELGDTVDQVESLIKKHDAFESLLATQDAKVLVFNVEMLLCFFIFFVIFSARCNIYISCLCYNVSVRLSVTEVHCGHRVQWISDTFACLDRWMSLLLTDNASPGSSDGMMSGFLV